MELQSLQFHNKSIPHKINDKIKRFANGWIKKNAVHRFYSSPIHAKLKNVLLASIELGSSPMGVHALTN